MAYATAARSDEAGFLAPKEAKAETATALVAARRPEVARPSNLGEAGQFLYPTSRHLTLFIDLNDGHWTPDPPDIDDSEQAMRAVATGEIGEQP